MKGNLYITENQQSSREMWQTVINYIYVSHNVLKYVRF